MWNLVYKITRYWLYCRSTDYECTNFIRVLNAGSYISSKHIPRVGVLAFPWISLNLCLIWGYREEIIRQRNSENWDTQPRTPGRRRRRRRRSMSQLSHDSMSPGNGSLDNKLSSRQSLKQYKFHSYSSFWLLSSISGRIPPGLFMTMWNQVCYLHDNSAFIVYCCYSPLINQSQTIFVALAAMQNCKKKIRFQGPCLFARHIWVFSLVTFN
jgi:hypothetical protein